MCVCRYLLVCIEMLLRGFSIFFFLFSLFGKLPRRTLETEMIVIQLLLPLLPFFSFPARDKLQCINVFFRIPFSNFSDDANWFIIQLLQFNGKNCFSKKAYCYLHIKAKEGKEGKKERKKSWNLWHAIRHSLHLNLNDCSHVQNSFDW